MLTYDSANQLARALLLAHAHRAKRAAQHVPSLAVRSADEVPAGDSAYARRGAALHPSDDPIFGDVFEGVNETDEEEGTVETDEEEGTVETDDEEGTVETDDDAVETDDASGEVDAHRSVGLDSPDSMDALFRACHAWERTCVVFLYHTGHEPCERHWPMWRQYARSQAGALCAHLEVSSHLGELHARHGPTDWPAIVRCHNGERRMIDLTTISGEAAKGGHEVTKLEEVEQLIRTASPKHVVLVGFFAKWCSHCVELKPKWHSSVSTIKGPTWCTIDCSDSDAPGLRLFESLKLKGFPTILAFDGAAPRVFPNRGKDTTAEDIAAFAHSR